jgi:5-methylcytosine-specific restriction protein A
MSRYLPVGDFEGSDYYSLFPAGHCQWCGKALPPRCKRFCPSELAKFLDGFRYHYPRCRVAWERWWYSRPCYQRVILVRDNFTCQLCGARPTTVLPEGVERPDLHQLHVDHIIPYSQTYKTEMSNLQTLCAQCNLKKGTKIPPAALAEEQDEDE